ncbi:helix-turn-helix domain-containing protein [Promicromonospora sp. NPDC059942]|uniref:helix-turn-helix domain-containing protein n=1 Tax=Promicromonospora sp. NPDC059942 TaxID=3347009 RepID=UPI0036490BEA
MASEKRPRRVPAVIADTRRNPGFALGAFGLSAWAYIGMSHTIAAYEGPRLGYALGVAYEALVIGLAWEGRRRADRALETGRPVSGHARWLGGAIVVGILSGALAAWHGWLLGEGIFAISRAVAPVLAAVAVHLFFQSASSSRALDRAAEIHNDRQTAVLDMLDAVRLAQIAPDAERAARIADVNAAVGRVHRHVPAAVTAEVTRPHLESERTIRDVVQEAATLAGEWMPEPNAPRRTPEEAAASAAALTEMVLPKLALPINPEDGSLVDPVEADSTADIAADTTPADAETISAERLHLEDKYAPVKPERTALPVSPPAEAPAAEWEDLSTEVAPTPAPAPVAAPALVAAPAEPAPALTTAQISEIRVLRWAQNLSIEEVAARLGVPIASVNRYAPSTDPTTETGSLMAISAVS